MKITDKIKDYQIARIVWDSNSKEQCKVIKKLRKKSIITPVCDGWYEVQTPQESKEDVVGILMPEECIDIV